MAEIEIKLAFERKHLKKALAAAKALTDARTLVTARLDAAYYDTADLRLYRKQITLRVRKEDGAFVQTVKHAGKDPLKRREWSDTVSGPAPDLGAPQTGKRLGRLAGRRLREQFRVIVTRQTAMLETPPDGRIELAVDTGRIAAERGKAETIGEVELELKEGRRPALYDAALKLAEEVPVYVEIRSKADRGFALAAAGRGRARAASTRRITPAKAPKIKPSATVREMVRAAGRHWIAAFLDNLPAARAGVPEAVHQMRVALRRFRSLLNAVKPLLPAAEHRWANGEIKRILDAFGPPRNWDVLIESTVAAVKTAEHPLRGRHDLLDAAKAERAKAYDRMRDTVTAGPQALAILKLLRWLETFGDDARGPAVRHLRTPLTEAASGLLDRQFKRVRKRGKNFAALAPEEKHKLRIALKTFRYTLELLRPAVGRKPVKALLKRIKGLQDKLGHLNDVRTSYTLLSAGFAAIHKDAELPAGLVLGWHENQAAHEEDELADEVRRLRKMKPFW